MIIYSPTWSCDKAPISQRMRRHVLREGTHGRMRALSPFPLTQSGMRIVAGDDVNDAGHLRGTNVGLAHELHRHEPHPIGVGTLTIGGGGASNLQSSAMSAFMAFTSALSTFKCTSSSCACTASRR